MTSGFDNSENTNFETNLPTASHHAYSNKWDLASAHNAPANPTGMQASHDILDTLRTKRGSQTAQWLNDLENLAVSQKSCAKNAKGSQTQTSIPSIPSENSANEQAMLNTAMRGLNKLFDEFENYASRFNITAEGTDFIVSCARPIRRDATKHVYGIVDNAGLSYAGHIATRFWAMIIRAIAGTVEVFIIPAELLLAFSVQKLDESKYKPLLVVQGEFRDEKLIWHIDNTIITLDQLPLLAKELFGDLIRVATGQMSESELFAHPLQELTLGESLAVGYSTNAPDVTLSTAMLNNPQAAPTDSNSNSSAQLALPSIIMAQQLLAAINQDINGLLESGKQTLQADDNVAFERIKVLTETMEALKISLSSSLANLPQPLEIKATKL